MNRKSFFGMILILIATLISQPAGATNCADNFPEGRFGLSLSDPAYASGKLHVKGFATTFLLKKRVSLDPEGGLDTCDHVYFADVFRLIYKEINGVLIAGCAGDFDGDRIRDYALLLKHEENGSTRPHVFLTRGMGYHVFSLGRVFDSFGYDGNPSIWPGPFCVEKPVSDVFHSPVDGQQVSVPGDLITVGWYTYFWQPEMKKFEKILTTD